MSKKISSPSVNWAYIRTTRDFRAWRNRIAGFMAIYIEEDFDRLHSERPDLLEGDIIDLLTYSPEDIFKKFTKIDRQMGYDALMYMAWKEVIRRVGHREIEVIVESMDDPKWQDIKDGRERALEYMDKQKTKRTTRQKVLETWRRAHANRDPEHPEFDDDENGGEK